MKAMLFSNHSYKVTVGAAARFVDQIGVGSVRRIECGTDGALKVIAIYYTED